MIYFLKTSNNCNNNCLYCDSLNKKHEKEKSTKEIKIEIDKAKKEGFKIIKYSCNTDCREDFLEIIKHTKKRKFKSILETNARIFCYKKLLEVASKYIDEFEVYFSFSSPDSAVFINDIENGFFSQSILGLRNITHIIDEDRVRAKIVLLNYNLVEIKKVIRNVASTGVVRVNFVYPFNLNHERKISPSISSMAKIMPQVLEHASQFGLEIMYGDELEYNPFKAIDGKLIDTKTNTIKFEKKLYSNKTQISVVIPTRNKNKHLKLVLESFFAQNIDKSSYEIIVVNDGGNRDTEEMIKSIDIKCNLKYVYWPRVSCEENEYVAKYSHFYNRAGLTRNIGANYAKGKILLFSDDDIIVSSDNLKKHLKKHGDNENYVLRAYRKYLPETYFPKKISIKEFNSNGKDELSQDGRAEKCRIYKINDEGWENIVTCNLSISKKLFLQAGGFGCDSPFWGLEDVELGYRLKMFNSFLEWDSDLIVYHLWHEPQTIDEHKKIMTFWINTNIFFRKYLDSRIYDIYQDTIISSLDKGIF